ncbi:MAG: TonB-dependent receptor [Abditibacteriales bacterium]|nr:TonB-dependent receptor [Abditibacteriales bacterium]MDW8366170.1 TonB-dependent receptor [Abditibacteriales bacterium]
MGWRKAGSCFWCTFIVLWLWFQSPVVAQTAKLEDAPKTGQDKENEKDKKPAPTGETPETLPEVVVTERSTNLVGIADSATQGTVGSLQLKQRPLLRPGELLETVPGVIITQHSGAGKANQFFLRGFNLDHGTDLAVSLDGMPLNFPTHGHGQGYLDLNFLIPELISGIEYRKGAYSAQQGDFSSAGSVDISYFNRLPSRLLHFNGGSFDFGRLITVGSSKNFVYGLELFHNDGPWTRPDDYRRFNAVLRYVQGDDRKRFTLTGMGYRGKWHATDQIPQRALDSGLLGRFDAIDPTDGGRTHRYSLSGQWQQRNEDSETRANFYVIDYKLNLFSNFTYFLDHPETNPPGRQGDQFEQADDRTVFGGGVSRRWRTVTFQREAENIVGLQFRHDRINPVGLYNTQNRVRFETVREDRVKQTSFAPYFENRIRWSDTFRTVAGVRWDAYRFNVNSSIPVNSGKTRDSILSPKLTMIVGPHHDTEFYLNLARGFHSNDARGTTITVDPKTGDPVDRVTPLVRAKMAEIGVRTARIKNLQSTLSLWRLDLDSELLFVGDAGTTEASRPSRRTGMEWTNYYTPNRWLTIDADLAISRARFTDDDPAGNRIPGAIEKTLALGVAVESPSGWFGSVRLRYFGPRPLIEDNSVRSKSSTLVNARLGYKFRNRPLRVTLEIFNLFNRQVSDIDYFYTSRLPGEPAAGVDDIHTHPAEKRSVRLSVQWEY